MKIDSQNNRIYFLDDDDLCNFAINKQLEVLQDEEGHDYMGWRFNDCYDDAIAANTEFIMDDLNSRALKNGMIDYRGICKPITISGNFEKIFEDIDKEMSEKEAKKQARQKNKGLSV